MGDGMGKGAKGYDCVIIPNAVKSTGKELVGMKGKTNPDKFCGASAGLVSTDGKKAADMMEKTICNSRAPFSVRFVSDNFESGEMGEAMSGTDMIQKGFKMTYTLKNCS